LLFVRAAIGQLREFVVRDGGLTRVARQSEPCTNALTQLKLTAPDYTTLSRRSAKLESKLKRRPSGPIHLIVDSTGLSVRGEGQWATWK
jgi:hypothetical protein